jgi:hypothetical protein
MVGPSPTAQQSHVMEEAVSQEEKRQVVSVFLQSTVQFHFTKIAVTLLPLLLIPRPHPFHFIFSFIPTHSSAKY